MEISSSDGLLPFLEKKLVSYIWSKSPQDPPRISYPRVGWQILQSRNQSCVCGITTHSMLPPCTWAFRAMVDKQDCILLEHLLSPRCLLQNQALQVWGECGVCLHGCRSWAGMIYLTFLVAGDKAPCSGWCTGQGKQLPKATPLAIPRVPSAHLLCGDSGKSLCDVESPGAGHQWWWCGLACAAEVAQHEHPWKCCQMHGPPTPACAGLPVWTLSKLAMSFDQHGTGQVGFTRCKQLIF